VSGVSGIDLNLLNALGALLEERNLTRAGAKLSLSQPTMSGALARLRRHFDDALLVRSGRQYVLTPMSERLLPDVQQALQQVERTLGVDGAEFDPVTSSRRFSIAIAGHSILTLSGLFQRVHELAPRTRLDLRPITPALLEGERGLLMYDLVIAPAGFLAGGQPEVICRDRFVYVGDAANPRLRDGRLSLADLAALPHVTAQRSRTEDDPVGRALERLGVKRTVVLTTIGWLPLPFAVAGTDLIAAVPERLARRASAATGVTIAEPPFETVELTEVAWWNPMHATDPALTWLCGIVHDALGSLTGSGGQLPADPLD
jgi:DNA-binding transcriptional LysR family regulator